MLEIIKNNDILEKTREMRKLHIINVKNKSPTNVELNNHLSETKKTWHLRLNLILTHYAILDSILIAN